MRIHTCSVLLAFTSALLAQAPEEAAASDPAPAAKPVGKAAARLANVLRRSARATDTSFEARWRKPQTMRRLGGGDEPADDRASGSWHADMLQVAFAGESDFALIQVGRQSIVRADDGAWRIGVGDPETLSKAAFVPDPPSLLLALAAVPDLDVVANAVEDVDGRAVETFAVRVTPSQSERLSFSGAMFDLDPMASMRRRAATRRRRPIRRAQGFVDLAIEVDVATGIARRVHVRGMQASSVVRRVTQGTATTSVSYGSPKEPPAALSETGPFSYERGLPKRATEGMQISELELTFGTPGKTPAPALSAAQGALLGR